MTTDDYFKLLVPILGSFAGLAIYVGRKLQVLGDLQAANVPARLAVLEAMAGVKYKVRT